MKLPALDNEPFHETFQICNTFFQRIYVLNRTQDLSHNMLCSSSLATDEDLSHNMPLVP